MATTSQTPDHRHVSPVGGGDPPSLADQIAVGSEDVSAEMGADLMVKPP